MEPFALMSEVREAVCVAVQSVKDHLLVLTLFEDGPERVHSGSSMCCLISVEGIMSRGPTYINVEKLRDGLEDLEGKG